MADHKSSSGNVDYQALREELDTILEQLQAGSLDIEAALKKYERGRVIIEQLEAFLAMSTNQVTKINTRLKNPET